LFGDESNRAEVFNGPRAKLATTPDTSYSDYNAAAGITYYYWLKACSTYGCTDYSAHATGQRDLGPPTNVQASDGSPDDLVRVTWNSFPGATYYEVWRAQTETGTKYLQGTSTTTTYDNAGVGYGVTYYYWVKSCNPGTCSGHSAMDSGGVPPLIPNTVAASNGTYPNKVRVTWNGQLGATYYQVWRTETANGIRTLLDSTTDISFEDRNPGDLSNYYRVKACNQLICSPGSEGVAIEKHRVFLPLVIR